MPIDWNKPIETYLGDSVQVLFNAESIPVIVGLFLERRIRYSGIQLPE